MLIQLGQNTKNYNEVLYVVNKMKHTKTVCTWGTLCEYDYKCGITKGINFFAIIGTVFHSSHTTSVELVKMKNILSKLSFKFNSSLIQITPNQKNHSTSVIFFFN